MRIKEIKICVRIIMTNSAIEFLRLPLKFYVLRISLAFKTFKGEYGTMCQYSNKYCCAKIHRGEVLMYSTNLPEKIQMCDDDNFIEVVLQYNF